MKITSNSTLNRQKKQKAQNDKILTSFLKELVENADLHKPVLSKIETTNE